MSDKKLILIGYSGHGIVLSDVALENQCVIIGYVDKLKAIQNPFNFEYLGYEGEIDFFPKHNSVEYIIGIGDNRIRERVYKFLKFNKQEVYTLISSYSNISSTASIGEGVFVNKNVSINAFARIGDNVLINTAAIVEHHCVIEDSAHIAPGVVLGGNVEIGKRSFIGANSVVKQGIIIGQDVVVGAGTVVIENIPDGKRVVGNPSRFI